MSCALIRPYLQAFVDDELSPERSIDVEQHLNACEECAAEVELTHSLAVATRVSVTEVPMCAEFRSRLCQCVADERKRQESPSHSPLSWRVIAPLAAAAALTLFFSYGYSRVNRHADEGWSAVSSVTNPASATAASATPDNLVDALVRHHASRVEPELTEAASVTRLEPQLGFPVHAPDLGRYGARFEGAAMVPMNGGSRAAVLRYNIAGKQVTFYMYNPDELPLRTQRALRPQVVGGRAVFVGNSRGYSIATCEQKGVGYAVTGELSNEESAELVAAVYSH